MESKCSHFWIGLGVGSILGAIVYRCCKTSKAQQLKNKVAHALHVATDQVEDFADTARDKVLETGTKVADKVADKTFDVAEKADEMKNKVHNFADNVKK
ncbi:MAG: YtxH domain-containing protein [Bacteroides sp.]|nr:YtxH domain-containing protein [Bacteroides sp.]